MLPEGYTYEELKTEDREFINGMKYVLDNCLGNFKYNYLEETEEEEMPTLNAIKNEIATAALNEFEEILSIDIDEMIVGMLDRYECE